MEYKNKWLTKQCGYCEKDFRRRKSYSRGKVRFCSVICSNRWKTENKLTGFYKGHPIYERNIWWKGKPLPENQRKNISKGLKDNPKNLKHIRELAKQHRGKNHWNWKGGITSLKRKLRQTKKYKEWQQAVYRKESWKCKICGRHCKKGNIIAHHKKSFEDYPKLRYVVSNGMTLCRKCHLLLHRRIINLQV